jgi:hypothetical protein
MSTQGREIAALQRVLDDREATIRDLRARLDSEAGERRAVQVKPDRNPDRSAAAARATQARAPAGSDSKPGGGGHDR